MLMKQKWGDIVMKDVGADRQRYGEMCRSRGIACGINFKTRFRLIMIDNLQCTGRYETEKLVRAKGNQKYGHVNTLESEEAGKIYRWKTVAAIYSKQWKDDMAIAEREPITGLGQSPSGVQGQSPWSEGQGAKPPEAERKLNFDNTITRLGLILH